MSEAKEYAFEAGVIRLNRRDLERWKRAFPNVAVESELWSLHKWAGEQKHWFPAVASALAKRQRDAFRPMARTRRIERDPLGNPIEVGDNDE